MQDMRDKLNIHGLFRLAAGVTVIVSIVTAIGVRHWAIELFGHFRLQYLVVAVLLIVIAVWLRAWREFAGLAIAAIISAALILPWYAMPDRLVAGSRPVNVMHANVLASNTDYERLAALLHETEPDIVFLQEVNGGWEKAIASLADDWPHTYFVTREDNFGIAVISKYPFASIRHVDSEPFGFPTLVGAVTLGESTLGFVSTHPMVPIKSRLRDDRNRQLESVAALVNAIPEPKLLIGDLNASLWDPALTDLETTTGLHNVRRGSGILPTWPTFFPIAMIPIDHAFVSADVSIKSAGVAADIGSDHLPLVLSLSL